MTKLRGGHIEIIAGNKLNNHGAFGIQLTWYYQSVAGSWHTTAKKSYIHYFYYLNLH